MAKYYISSGPVRLIFDAPTAMVAAVKAFQWSCDKQASIDADSALEHILIAESRGWQMQDEVVVSERGFGKLDGAIFDTIDVLAAWQEFPVPVV